MSAADDFLAHASQLADQAGIELDDDDLRELFEESHAGGFNAAATEAAFDALYGDDEEDYEDDDEGEDEMFDDSDEAEDPGTQRLADHLQTDLDRLETKLGRPLLNSEVDEFVQGAVEQVDRTGAYSVEQAQGATGAKSYSEMSRSEVNEAMVERARDLDPPDEPDPDRVYDLSDRKDFEDYAVQKMQGTEFEDSFSDAPDEAA